MGVRTPNLPLATSLLELIGNEETSPGVRRSARYPIPSASSLLEILGTEELSPGGPTRIARRPMADFFAGNRISLTANADFYVATTGSDTTGDGSSGNPWKTLPHAYSVLYAGYDLRGYSATIHVADGLYPQGMTVFGRLLGQRAYYDLNILGNLTNPENVIIQPLPPPTDYYAFGAAFGAMYRFEGFKFDMSNGAQDTVNCGKDAVLGFKNCIFGDTIHPWTDIIAYDNGQIYIEGDYTIEKSFVVKTANTSSGSNVLTSVSNFTGIKLYQGINGAGIPLDTFVSSFNVGAGTVTMSRNASANGTGVGVSFANGGAVHLSAGRRGGVAFFTDGVPGRAKVRIKGLPYYWQSTIFANGGSLDIQAVDWDTSEGNIQGAPVRVQANGIADLFAEGVGGDYPPSNAVYTDAASFSQGDEVITVGSGADIVEGMLINGLRTVTATLADGVDTFDVASLSPGIEGGCKLSGDGIGAGSHIIGITGSGPYTLKMSYPATVSGARTVKITGGGIANGTYVKKKVGASVTLSRPTRSAQSSLTIAVAGGVASGGQVL